MRKLPALVVATAVLAAVALSPASAVPAPPTAAGTAAGTAAATPPTYDATPLKSYPAFDANQAIAVDAKAFYAVNNRTITKHDRRTGEPLLQFAGDTDGPFKHMDSGVVVGSKLYAVHSNYPEWPMESSIEVFDTKTMRHVDTYSFGIYRGSLTWLDRHDGAWWAGFANYDDVSDETNEPYGQTYNTQVVKLNDKFEPVASWTIPKEILDRFKPMSNSGGSWGPDGRLWLTGHDLGEAYVMELPVAGSELRWIATVELPDVQGQGVAWDRSDPRHPTFWAISRPNRQVHTFSMPLGSLQTPTAKGWQVLGPGSFRK